MCTRVEGGQFRERDFDNLACRGALEGEYGSIEGANHYSRSGGCNPANTIGFAAISDDNSDCVQRAREMLQEVTAQKLHRKNPINSPHLHLLPQLSESGRKRPFPTPFCNNRFEWLRRSKSRQTSPLNGLFPRWKPGGDQNSRLVPRSWMCSTPVCERDNFWKATGRQLVPNTYSRPYCRGPPVNSGSCHGLMLVP